MTTMRRSSRSERPRAQREREAEVSVETSLVELVEHEDADAVERRVALKPARQHALGDDLDARGAANAPLSAHAVADRLAHFLAAQVGQPPRRGARRHSPRLEHHDRLSIEPGSVEQRERNHRRLARARRRLHDDAPALTQRVADGGQDRLDGEGQGHG